MYINVYIKMAECTCVLALATFLLLQKKWHPNFLHPQFSAPPIFGTPNFWHPLILGYAAPPIFGTPNFWHPLILGYAAPPSAIFLGLRDLPLENWHP